MGGKPEIIPKKLYFSKAISKKTVYAEIVGTHGSCVRR